MGSIRQSNKTAGKSFRMLALLSGAVLLTVVILLFWDPPIFRRFLGATNALIVFLGAMFPGFWAIYWLTTRHRLSIHEKGSLSAAFRTHGVVLLFPCIAILVDLAIVFPRDTNILFPKSLLFYPAIAFLVEVLFHLLPLWVVLFLLDIFARSKMKQSMWLGLVVVALLEPTFQIFFMESLPIWASVVIWCNLFAFNLFQLNTFRRYGFFVMYILRLIYYLIWHILWGALRLEILFNG